MENYTFCDAALENAQPVVNMWVQMPVVWMRSANLTHAGPRMVRSTDSNLITSDFGPELPTCVVLIAVFAGYFHGEDRP
jgi:hypothetical protein